MHAYVCPYCDPCREANMIRTAPKAVPPEKKGLFGRKIKNQAPGHKEVMRCLKCENEFKIVKGFLEKQKRKIKDG